jgi:MerR family transcriptional regulator, light-induced transcriptional regulator
MPSIEEQRCFATLRWSSREETALKASSQQSAKGDGFMSAEPVHQDKRRPARSEKPDTVDSDLGPEFDSVDTRLRFALTKQVIPRLRALNRVIVAAETIHGKMGDPSFHTAREKDVSHITNPHIETLMGLLAADKLDERHALYEDLFLHGSSFEEICDQLLAATARRLGDLWMDDAMSFAAVSEGTSALHSDLIWLSERSGATPVVSNSLEHSVLVFPFPGERHIFGAAVLGESFRHAGWLVDVIAPQSLDACINTVSGEFYDIVAISVPRVEIFDSVTTLIAGLRQNSRNKSVKIMVGGPAIDKIETARRLGADATSFTGQDAVFQANMMLD